jgi:hypothetical protein
LAEVVGLIRDGGGTDNDDYDNEFDDGSENEDYNLDEEDDELDEEHEANKPKPGQIQGRQSSCNKPSKKSQLGRYLEMRKEEILDLKNNKDVKSGKCWYGPSFDAVARGSHDPIIWCQEVNSDVFFFHPFSQYEKKIPKKLSQYQCVRCGESGNLQSNR